jgi:hypothetical protein
VADTAVSRIDLLASHDCFRLPHVRAFDFLSVSRRIVKGCSLRVPQRKGSSSEETKQELPPSLVGEVLDRIEGTHLRSQYIVKLYDITIGKIL